MVKLEDDREALQDARFFDAVDYILIIPRASQRTFPRAEALWRKIPGLPRPRGVTPICW